MPRVYDWGFNHKHLKQQFPKRTPLIKKLRKNINATKEMQDKKWNRNFCFLYPFAWHFCIVGCNLWSADSISWNLALVLICSNCIWFQENVSAFFFPFDNVVFYLALMAREKSTTKPQTKMWRCGVNGTCCCPFPSSFVSSYLVAALFTGRR